MKLHRAALAAAVLIGLGAATARGDAPAPLSIVPQPLQEKLADGHFTLGDSTVIVAGAGTQATADYLHDLLAAPTGAALKIFEPAPTVPPGAIVLTRNGADATLGDEGYELNITPDRITIRASGSAGMFYGVQTLRQLLPVEIERRDKVSGVAWDAPCVSIKDRPRYPWRGYMLDVARHFFTKPQVEKFLDLMALHKLNVFHIHLVDDQGWRIEIKKYPKLTQIGAWRNGVGFGFDPKSTDNYDAQGRYGGFYTQDNIREMVAYAARLHITIVPEIEMPGHSGAAVRAYPWLSSTPLMADGSIPRGGLSDVCNPANEATFTFIDDVLGEVAGLFPGKYLHVGGDEVSKGPWHSNPQCQAFMKQHGLKNEDELQSYFMKRVEKIVASKGRHMIGWDEILEGGLAPGAAVMSWRGMQGGIAAAQAGHDVVMSPTSNAYFDYRQTLIPEKERAIGGYLPLQKVYSFEPTPASLSPQMARLILGPQGNLWTEYVPNMARAEYMTFPRACAMAEVGWTARDQRDWKGFEARLQGDLRRLKALHVNCFVDPMADAVQIGGWNPGQMSQQLKTLGWKVKSPLKQAGQYVALFHYTHGACLLEIDSVSLLEDGKVIATDKHKGRTGGSESANAYLLNVEKIQSGASYELRALVRSDGGTDSNGVIYFGREAH